MALLSNRRRGAATPRRYRALDTVLTGLSRPTKAQVESAMQGHVLAQARLIGTYRKTQ